MDSKKKMTPALILLIILCVLAISAAIIVTLSVQGIIPLTLNNSTKLQDLSWRIANFFVLITILHSILTDKIIDFVKGRRSAIESALTDAKVAKEGAEVRYEEISTILSKASKEIDDIRKSFIEEGEKERKKLIENAEKEAENIRSQTEIIANQELSKARFSLRAEAVDLTVNIAEELLKKNITTDDQKKIVKEYIDKTIRLRD